MPLTGVMKQHSEESSGRDVLEYPFSATVSVCQSNTSHLFGIYTLYLD